MLEPTPIGPTAKHIPIPISDDLPVDEISIRAKPLSRQPVSDNLPIDSTDWYSQFNSPLPTQDDLPSDDGVPMETARHKAQMELLINSLKPWLAQHGGGYVGGNMFVHFSLKQVRNEDFRGPDFFVVLGVENKERKSWVVWEERKSLDIVIELLSGTTASKDKHEKKLAYQNELKVSEYFWFDPWNPDDLAGFRLQKRPNGVYDEILPNSQNQLISQSLGLVLTRWRGVYDDIDAVWLRWQTLDGELLPTPQECADAEKERADAAEAENARLKALLNL